MTHVLEQKDFTYQDGSISQADPEVVLKGPRMAKTVLKKNKIGGLILSNSKFNTKYNNQDVCQWHTDRHISKWNRIMSPEINPFYMFVIN